MSRLDAERATRAAHMIPLRLYGYAAAAVGLLATVGTAYTVGRLDGRAHERSACLSREAQRTAAAERDRAEWRAQIDAWEAERRRLEQEAADAVAEIRIEYLPGRTEVRKQIVERAVYRDCRIDDGMHDILNAALRGRPVAPDTRPVAVGGGVVPGRTAGHG